MIAAAVCKPEANERRYLSNREVLMPPQGFGAKALNIGTQGVQELFFGERRDFGDSRIKSMTCKMFH